MRTDQEHVDRGLLTVMWSSRPGLQVYRRTRKGSRRLRTVTGKRRMLNLYDRTRGGVRGRSPLGGARRVHAVQGACAPRAARHVGTPHLNYLQGAGEHVRGLQASSCPPCRGVAQPSLTARDWQQRTSLTGSVDRLMGHLMLPVNQEQCSSPPPASLFPASSANPGVLLERSAPCGFPPDIWELVLQNVPMLVAGSRPLGAAVVSLVAGRVAGCSLLIT